MAKRSHGRMSDKGGILTSLTSGGGGVVHINTTLNRFEKNQAAARSKSAISLASQRRHVIKPGVQEVCWIHPGDVIGDVEVVLGIPTYLWTAIAGAEIEIYQMSVENFMRIYHFYENNEMMALEMEQECYDKIAQRFERINTPFCNDLSQHLRTNLHEAAEAIHEAQRANEVFFCHFHIMFLVLYNFCISVARMES